MFAEVVDKWNNEGDNLGRKWPRMTEFTSFQAESGRIAALLVVFSQLWDSERITTDLLHRFKVGMATIFTSKLGFPGLKL